MAESLTRSSRKWNPALVVGIDPDLSRTGIAIYDTASKKLIDCRSIKFMEVVKVVLSLPLETTLVRVEAGWLVRKSNWHSRKTMKVLEKKGITGERASNIAQRQAKNVGENHAIGKIIAETLTDAGFNVELIPPAGYSQFFDNNLFFKRQTGYPGRTNKDARAAAAMCWKYK